MKVLVVDDEAPARARLCRILADFDMVSDIAEAIDGLDALEKIDKLSPDILFLDIQMPGMSGLELAKKLGNEGPAIIFVTAFDQYAISAFETFALDYLLKPVVSSRVIKSFEKINSNISDYKEKTKQWLSHEYTKSSLKITVKSRGEYRVLNVESISAIVAKSPYLEIYYLESKFLCDGSLEGVLKEIKSQQFIKIHKSHAINIDYVEKITRLGDRKYQVHLNDHYQNLLAVGRTKIVELKLKINFK